MRVSELLSPRPGSSNRKGATTLTPFVLLLGLHLATLAPSFEPAAIYVPRIATVVHGGIFLIGAAIAGSCLFLAVLRVVHVAMPPSSRWPARVAMTVVVVAYLSLLLADAFYAKFGIFPSPRIILDFVAAPSAFVAYTKSGTSFWDTATLAVAALTIVAAVVAATRVVWRERPFKWRPVVNLVFGVALMWWIRAVASPELDREQAFMVSEHSLPIAKYAFEAMTAFDTNGIQNARATVPVPTSPSDAPILPRAHHVLLVLAECLRADHLPAYGYQRNTTPFLQSDSENWVVLNHAYSHGPRTADSFPAIFNSQYFAAIDGRNTGAQALWTTLRSHDVGSAFLSAGAMEWGGITHAVDLPDVDYPLIASNVDSSLRKEVTSQPFDYGVDDDIPFRRYVSLLGHELKTRPSFVALHFVGSHYPFHYDDVPDEFLPSVRKSPDDGQHPPARWLTVRASGPNVIPETSLLRVANAYDNSILHIDKMMREVIEALRRLDILDDSVVIFTADHGESLGEHRTLFHGTTLYEEQVHVPMLIRVGSNLRPLRDPLERRASQVVGQVDIVPTVLDALVGRPNTRPFEGMSWFSTATKPYELLLFRGLGEQIGLVTPTRKFVFDVLGRRSEEYALSEDPREEHNLSTARDDTFDGFVNRARQAGFAVRPITGDAQN